MTEREGGLEYEKIMDKKDWKQVWEGKGYIRDIQSWENLSKIGK